MKRNKTGGYIGLIGLIIVIAIMSYVFVVLAKSWSGAAQTSTTGESTSSPIEAAQGAKDLLENKQLDI